MMFRNMDDEISGYGEYPGEVVHMKSDVYGINVCSSNRFTNHTGGNLANGLPPALNFCERFLVQSDVGTKGGLFVVFRG